MAKDRSESQPTPTRREALIRGTSMSVLAIGGWPQALGAADSGEDGALSRLLRWLRDKTPPVGESTTPADTEVRTAPAPPATPKTLFSRAEALRADIGAIRAGLGIEEYASEPTLHQARPDTVDVYVAAIETSEKIGLAYGRFGFVAPAPAVIHPGEANADGALRAIMNAGAAVSALAAELGIAQLSTTARELHSTASLDTTLTTLKQCSSTLDAVLRRRPKLQDLAVRLAQSRPSASESRAHSRSRHRRARPTPRDQAQTRGRWHSCCCARGSRAPRSRCGSGWQRDGRSRRRSPKG